MKNARTWIIAVVALIVGAGAAYFLMQTQIESLSGQVSSLEDQLSEANVARDAAQAEVSSLNEQLSSLEGRLSEANVARDAAQAEVSSLNEQLSSLEGRLSEANAASEAAQTEISDLARQIAALDNALSAKAQDVADRDARIGDAEQKAQISDADRQLNLALAQRIRELSRYRSEFFGKLAQILSSRDDVRVVGDRFIFQSGVLFPTASASINEAGRAELDKLADALIELEQEIPDELDWVLRVGGHTDKRPINSLEFRSNWELSAARAISVVRYLIDRGVPPNRLVAAAFGEYRPLDEGESEEALGRNRRIELKLTER